MAKAHQIEFIHVKARNYYLVQCVSKDGAIVHVGNEYGAITRHAPNAHVVAELEATAQRWVAKLGVPLIRHRW
jgi:hypothetical protein